MHHGGEGWGGSVRLLVILSLARSKPRDHSLPLIYVHGSSLNAEDDNFIKETILRKIII